MPIRFPTAKAAWVAAVNSPELVYVSGRVRQPDEINGKSGNLNNALNLIYPPGVDIPLDEASQSGSMQPCDPDASHAPLHMLRWVSRHAASILQRCPLGCSPGRGRGCIRRGLCC